MKDKNIIPLDQFTNTGFSPGQSNEDGDDTKIVIEKVNQPYKIDVKLVEKLNEYGSKIGKTRGGNSAILSSIVHELLNDKSFIDALVLRANARYHINVFEHKHTENPTVQKSFWLDKKQVDALREIGVLVGRKNGGAAKVVNEMLIEGFKRHPLRSVK